MFRRSGSGWSAVAAAAIVDRTLVSKAAIRDELGSRLAEFAPPGEHLQGLFVDERGQIPFAAQMRDQQGRLHRIRLRIAQKWRVEATALTAAARGSQPGYGAPEPGSGY